MKGVNGLIIVAMMMSWQVGRSLRTIPTSSSDDSTMSFAQFIVRLEERGPFA